MAKNIQIKLLKIKYDGDSVGDDIRIEIEHPGGLWSFDKKIKNKSDINIEKIIYQFVATSNTDSIPLDIKVVEKDLVFNDVGNIKIDLGVDLNNSKPQISTHEVVVKESRGMTPGSKKAIFSLILEVLVSENIRYIPLTDDGWFLCRREGFKSKIDLPSFLKLHFDYVNSGKEYFTILEGGHKGIQMYASEEREKKFHFLQENPQIDAVDLIYSISKKTLKLNNKTYLTTDSLNAPWKKGLYDIEIPDYSHKGGLYYEESKFARVWFRIGHNGDRYLHTGAHSLGCMTVIEVKKWDEIFGILIKARKGDGESVGILKVVD